MNHDRRTLLLAAAASLAGAASAQPARFPNLPIKLVVPYAAGGVGDLVARVLSERASRELGQPVLVENRTGAGGAIGAEAVARAKPDGYTLLLMATAHVILPALQKTSYDWERDLAPVFGVTSSPLLFAVSASSSIRSLNDLAAAGNAAAGGINYASGGAGSISHLAEVRLMQVLKSKGTHVAYRGFSSAVEALLGGQVDLVCAAYADLGQLVQAGKVRVLAVTADKRYFALPDVPTMLEQGFQDFTAASWNAVMAPEGIPADIAERLHQAFAKAAQDPGVRERLSKLGVGWMPKTRAELGQFQREESARWKRVVQENGIKLVA